MPQLFRVCLRISKLENILPSLSAEDHFFHYFSRAVHHYFFFFFLFNAQDVQINSTFHTWNFPPPLSGFQIKPNYNDKIMFYIATPQTRVN